MKVVNISRKEEEKKSTKPENDSQSLSMLVQNVSEETKQEEASRFDETNSQTLKKMQDLQAMIKGAQPNAEADDFENEDEFDSYMENALM